MKVLISAAEASADIHGAFLLKELRKKNPNIEAFGIGGPKLQAAGLRAVVDSKGLMVMGITEVFGRLPRILRALNTLVAEAEKEEPKIAIVMDYPDFHFRLAKRLRRLHIPLVYYIPPKVWVWRKGRVKLLRELFDHVFCIFPFEEKLLRESQVCATYVGNPLLEELPLDISRQQARIQLGLREDDLVLAILPGSRPAEIRKHVPILLDTLKLLATRLRTPLHVLMPLPTLIEVEEVQNRVELWLQSHSGVSIQTSMGNSHTCLIAADAALVKSGTSTLEAALLGCPHVVFYRPSWVTGMIFKHLVRYQGPIGLVNLGGSTIAKEMICEAVTPKNLSDEAYSLLMDESRRALMKDQFQKVRESYLNREGASARVAQEILNFVGV